MRGGGRLLLCLMLVTAITVHSACADRFSVSVVAGILVRVFCSQPPKSSLNCQQGIDESI